MCRIFFFLTYLFRTKTCEGTGEGAGSAETGELCRRPARPWPAARGVRRASPEGPGRDDTAPRSLVSSTAARGGGGAGSRGSCQPELPADGTLHGWYQVFQKGIWAAPLPVPCGAQMRGTKGTRTPADSCVGRVGKQGEQRVPPGEA